MRTSIWVPAKVDVVACLPLNRLFFRRNRRISRSVLRGNATISLTQPQQRQKRQSEQKKTLNEQYTFWQVSLAVIARLTLSNVTETAMQSSL